MAIGLLFSALGCGGGGAAGGPEGDPEIPLVFDLPFRYSIPAGADRLEVATPQGIVYVSLGPYGAHFPPLTGHMGGDGKANWQGFLPKDDTEMTELEGDGDGHREAGEVWGYWAGEDGSRVRDRNPLYAAPLNGTIESILYVAGPSAFYFDEVPHWNITLRLPGELRLRFGHIGRLARELRDRVLALTGIDTDTFRGAPGTEILAPLGVSVSEGGPLAYPQIVAPEIPSHPGYTGGSSCPYPWAQMEVFVFGGNATDCIYDFLPPQRYAELQAVMDRDMANPESQRYRDGPYHQRWLWSAEARLSLGPAGALDDFSDLTSRRGGWFEAGESPDEIFVYATMAKDTANFNAALYDSPGVNFLVARMKSGGGSFSWTMPDGNTIWTSAPAGEVLERSGSHLLVKWREVGYTNPLEGGEDVVYQAVAYRLDPTGLRLKWGEFADRRDLVVRPALSPDEPANDLDVLSYDHLYKPGF